MAKRAPEEPVKEPLTDQYYFPGNEEVQAVTITADSIEDAQEQYANYVKTGKL